MAKQTKGTLIERLVKEMTILVLVCFVKSKGIKSMTSGQKGLLFSLTLLSKGNEIHY